MRAFRISPSFAAGVGKSDFYLFTFTTAGPPWAAVAHSKAFDQYILAMLLGDPGHDLVSIALMPMGIKITRAEY